MNQFAFSLIGRAIAVVLTLTPGDFAAAQAPPHDSFSIASIPEPEAVMTRMGIKNVVTEDTFFHELNRPKVREKIWPEIDKAHQIKILQLYTIAKFRTSDPALINSIGRTLVLYYKDLKDKLSYIKDPEKLLNGGMMNLELMGKQLDLFLPEFELLKIGIHIEKKIDELIEVIRKEAERERKEAERERKEAERRIKEIEAQIAILDQLLKAL